MRRLRLDDPRVPTISLNLAEVGVILGRGTEAERAALHDRLRLQEGYIMHVLAPDDAFTESDISPEENAKAPAVYAALRRCFIAKAWI